jgi:hypothetical protein
MKVIVKDSDGKILQKLWGNLVCVHDLDEKDFKVADASGNILLSVSEPKCVHENELDGTITVEVA